MKTEATIRKILAPAIPYIAIGAGLLLFHNAWLAIFSYHLGIILLVHFSGVGVPVRLVFRSRDYRLPVLAAMLGGAGGILLYVLWPMLAVPDDIELYLQSIRLNAGIWPVFLVYFVVVNPLIEEYYWRGCLGSKRQGPVLNDLWFSGYHLLVMAGNIGVMWLPVVFLVLAVVAWFWRQIDRLGEGLLPSIVSHIAGGIAVITTIYYMSMW